MRAAKDFDIETAGADDRFFGIGFAVPYGQEAVILDETTGSLVLDDGEGQVATLASGLPVLSAAGAAA